MQKIQQAGIAVVLWSAIAAPAYAQSSTPSAPLPSLRPISTSMTPIVNPNAYRLGSGDQLQITVANYEEVTRESTVMPDGSITLPLIGSVKVEGLTTEALAKQLQTRWNRYLINPNVSVSLLGKRPVTVSVSGEVQRPGPRKFTATDGNANLMAAIAAAGGITRNADISKVTVKRRLPGQDVTMLTYNLWESVNTDEMPADLALQDGDAISIPRLTADAIVDRRLVARSSLAANTVRVRVVGEVKQPGEVQVPPDSSLSSAIAIAGGPTNDSKLSEVTFIRVNDQGLTEQKKLDLSKLNDQVQVQDGDVLIVPKQPAARALDTANRVISPFGILLRLFTGW